MTVLNHFKVLYRQMTYWVGRLGYEVVRAISGVMLKLGFQLQVTGAEYLQSYSSYILAGNHTGFLDSLILVAACPTMLYFVMERSVYQWAIVGPLLRVFPNIVPIRQSSPRSGLTQATKTLRQDKPLVIFPEGKLTRDGQLNPFKPGVFRLQDATEKPVIPFTIKGGFEAWGWGQLLPTFCPIQVTFHSPFDVTEELAGAGYKKMSFKERAQQLELIVKSDIA